jgi:hypothetical protein
MTDERVSLEEVEASQPMPASLVATFGFDQWYWISNEDGHADKDVRPNVFDVEDMVRGVGER